MRSLKCVFKFVTKNSAICLSKGFFAECGQLHKAFVNHASGGEYYFMLLISGEYYFMLLLYYSLLSRITEMFYEKC